MSEKIDMHFDDDPEFELPDVVKLTNDTINILEYILENNLHHLSQDEKIDIIEEKFPQYTSRHFSVLNVITKKCDIDNLINMLRSLYNIGKNNKLLKTEIPLLKNMLETQYIPENIRNLINK